MKRKKCYETPLIARSQVEIEDGLCAASGEMVVKDSNTEVTIERQEGDSNDDFTIEGWE